MKNNNWFNAVKALQVPAGSPALEIEVGHGRFARELGSMFAIDPANALLHLAAKRKIMDTLFTNMPISSVPKNGRNLSRIRVLQLQTVAPRSLKNRVQ